MSATNNATTLPLSQLCIDPKSNVRHANRGLDAVLLASIKAIGLRSPLNVRKNGKGYVIFAGGQRFLALQEIAKEQNTPDMPVPVIITDEDDAKAREASLHENVARSAMHPVDEHRAFMHLVTDKENPLNVEQIATRFGVDVRTVNQRLALGQLDDSVLDAWLAGELDGKIARIFTLADKKAQKTAMEKIRKENHFLNDYTVRNMLDLVTGRAGKLLDLVTEEAYRARGGHVTKDLFADENNDNTVVSDPALLRTMADELLDKTVERLKAEGWGNVLKAQSEWQYQRIDVSGKATKKEAARLKEIEKLFEAAEQADEYFEDEDKLEDERNAIQQAIEERALASIDPKVKANAFVFVHFTYDHSRIEIEYRNPPEKERGLGLDAAQKAKAKKEAAPADAISQALLLRQAEQLTAAAKDAITHQPHVAMAILIAGITSNDDALGIHQTGNYRETAKFAPTLAAALKMSTTEQIKALTTIVGSQINLVKRYPAAAVLDDPSHRALAEAIDGKRLTAATRENFDATDYFNSVSRATIVDAVREAMGDDHARKVAAMTKADAAKFAYANLPKTKWLPKQLRVPAYDGPAAKAKPAKAPAKKAAAKKAPAKKAKR